MRTFTIAISLALSLSSPRPHPCIYIGSEYTLAKLRVPLTCLYIISLIIAHTLHIICVCFMHLSFRCSVMHMALREKERKKASNHTNNTTNKNFYITLVIFIAAAFVCMTLCNKWSQLVFILYIYMIRFVQIIFQCSFFFAWSCRAFGIKW